jgi:hypothetical protein
MKLLLRVFLKIKTTSLTKFKVVTLLEILNLFSVKLKMLKLKNGERDLVETNEFIEK